MKNNFKLWLVGMTGPNKKENLQELIDPIIEYFDGLVWTFHFPKDEGAEYLESKKKDGEIIYLKYSQRHDFSRNAYLYCGPIKEGDWCVQIDDLERLNVDFAKNIKDYIAEFERKDVALAFYYGKPFLFKHGEDLSYRGSPHECLVTTDKNGFQIELNRYFPDEKNVRLNVRPLKRKDPFNWVEHYAKYHLFPYGSNSCALGLEKWGSDFRNNFQQRESKRLEFRRLMRSLGYPLTLDGLKDMFSKPLTKEILEHINYDKVWNDYYRYIILKDTTVIDTHEPKDMKEIKL